MGYRFYAWMMMCLGLMVFAACDRNATPTPAGQAPQAAAQPPREAPPPPPAASTEDRSLAFFPLDVNKFSMEAIQANKQRVQANPADAEALMQLGHANYMIQRFPTAKDYYEQAVRANGKLADACHAFRIGPLLTAAEAPEPLQRRCTTVFILIEDDLRLRHGAL